MKPIQEHFSVVLRGGWNPQIFSSDWITEYLLVDKESTISAHMPVNPMEPPRIVFENQWLYPSLTSLRISPSDPTLDNLKQSAALAIKLLDLLEHTPVTGIGVNFAYQDDQTNESSQSKYGVSDYVDLSGRYVVNSTDISRSLLCEEATSLNMLIKYTDTNAMFRFNFHNEIANDKAICHEKLSDRIIDIYNNIANDILGVYDHEIN